MEDMLAYCQVVKTLHARIRQQDEAQFDPELSIETVQAPTTPFSEEGYRRLLSGAVVCTCRDMLLARQAQWHGLLCVKGVGFCFPMMLVMYVWMEEEYWAAQWHHAESHRVGVHLYSLKTKSMIMLSSARPNELEHVNLYDFISLFDIKHISKKTIRISWCFPLDEHPQESSMFCGLVY
jgi:hypothetical protein